jgi:hypothetical protein
MTWRVATQPGKTAQEVIDPEDWNAFTTEQQQAYEAVSEFKTEQEAEKFGKAQVAAANAINPKMPRRYRS